MNKNISRPARADEQNASLSRLEPFGHFKPNFLQLLIISLCYGTFLSRGSARRWISGIVAYLGQPIDVFRESCRYRLYLSNNLIEYGLLLRKGFNRTELDFLKSSLTSNCVAVDIGCNMGLYTLQLAKSGAKVVAIDANPLMISQLRFNILANDMKNVSTFLCAVGNLAGKADLHIRNDDLAIAAVVENESGSILVRTLEHILKEAGVDRVDALKIDVEGYEDKALAPFLNTCPEQMLPKRIVIEEISEHDHPECQSAFLKRGYTLVQRVRHNALYQLKRLPTT